MRTRRPARRAPRSQTSRRNGSPRRAAPLFLRRRDVAAASGPAHAPMHPVPRSHPAAASQANRGPFCFSRDFHIFYSTNSGHAPTHRHGAQGWSTHASVAPRRRPRHGRTLHGDAHHAECTGMLRARGHPLRLAVRRRTVGASVWCDVSARWPGELPGRAAANRGGWHACAPARCPGPRPITVRTPIFAAGPVLTHSALTGRARCETRHPQIWQSSATAPTAPTTRHHAHATAWLHRTTPVQSDPVEPRRTPANANANAPPPPETLTHAVRVHALSALAAAA